MALFGMERSHQSGQGDAICYRALRFKNGCGVLAGNSRWWPDDRGLTRGVPLNDERRARLEPNARRFTRNTSTMPLSNDVQDLRNRAMEVAATAPRAEPARPVEINVGWTERLLRSRSDGDEEGAHWRTSTTPWWRSDTHPSGRRCCGSTRADRP